MTYTEIILRELTLKKFCKRNLIKKFHENLTDGLFADTNHIQTVGRMDGPSEKRGLHVWRSSFNPSSSPV